MTESLPPRTAIVTGAGRGIGAAIALRLARDGVAVAVLDLDLDLAAEVAERIAHDGAASLAVRADVTDEDSVERAVQTVADQLGQPTILVNNAGITRDNSLHRMSLADWESVLAVHGRGAFLMTRAAQRHMVSARWGRIVNISSGSALGNPGQANYSMAKAGLQGFTKTVALELGKFGITANAVAPGFIDSEMTAAIAARQGVPFEQVKADAASRIAVGRVGTPEDVAAAVAFFAGDETSFVTGQVLYVAGSPRS